MRFDFGDEVRARNQARVQRRLRERPGNFQIWRCDQYNGEFCGGFHFIGDEKFAAYLYVRRQIWFHSGVAGYKRERIRRN